MTTMLRLSAMVEELRPTLVKFIGVLGYSAEEAKRFAEGYIEAVKNLPTLMHKLAAIESMEDSCMAAGFKAAGIDYETALLRYQEKFPQ